jgi:hypothetical protein
MLRHKNINQKNKVDKPPKIDTKKSNYERIVDIVENNNPQNNKENQIEEQKKYKFTIA